MKKIFIIIDTPIERQAFQLFKVLKENFALTSIHTGQHYDAEILKSYTPDINLSLVKTTREGDLNHKLYFSNEDYLKNKEAVIQELISYDGDLGQLGEIRDKLNIEFEKGKPDLVIVFGDVTSTLAAGLATKKLNIDLAHVETRLQDGNFKIPEEVNRVLINHISKYYFITEESSIDNLKEIGIAENVYLVGNTIIDSQKSYEKILVVLLLEYYNENIKYYLTNHPPYKHLFGFEYLAHLNKTMNLDSISYNFFKTWINLFLTNRFHIFQFLNKLLHKFNNVFLYNLKPYYWKFKDIDKSFFSNDKIITKSKEHFNFVNIDMSNVKHKSNDLIITSADITYFEKYFFKYDMKDLLNKKETIFICCDVNDYNIIKNKLIKFNNVGYVIFKNIDIPRREYYQSMRIFGLYFLRQHINFKKSFIFNIDTGIKCKHIFTDVIKCTKNSNTKLILAGWGDDNLPLANGVTIPLYAKGCMNKVLIYNTDFIDLFYKIYLYQYFNLDDKCFLDQIALFIASNYSAIPKEYTNIDKLIVGCAKYKY